MALAFGGTYAGFRTPAPMSPWTERERQTLLLLAGPPALLPARSNAVADDPRAQRLGHRLFFDPRFSSNGQVACSSCHQPARRFTDGLPQARAFPQRPAEAGDALPCSAISAPDNSAAGCGPLPEPSAERFNTSSLVGAAYSPWFFWDGRKDSLWSQAQSPLEHPLEQGGDRTRFARLIAEDGIYREEYSALFGTLPDFADRRRFPDAASPNGSASAQAAWAAMAPADREAVTTLLVNLGKALAAYQRLLLPGEARFDRYAKTLASAAPGPSLSRMEAEGLRLFIGKAQCINCHNGPLFTNQEFHNTGLLPAPGSLPSKGRIAGALLVRSDPFNCLGRYSDASPSDCAELRFMRTGAELIGAQKTPSLRNLQGTAPYMHAGQMPAISALLDHYNRAPAAILGHNEAKPLNLLPYQLRQLEAFLGTLDAPLATAPEWLAPPAEAGQLLRAQPHQAFSSTSPTL